MTGKVIDDLVAKELTEKMGSNLYVQPATVIVTSSGELQRTHDVKKIFHVAAVQGEVGVGYAPIKNIQRCVTNVLEEADSQELRGLGIRSILFPLLGTGTAGGPLKETVEKLLQAVISYYETAANTSIECVYFLTWTGIELETCQAVFQQCKKFLEANIEPAIKD